MKLGLTPPFAGLLAGTILLLAIASAIGALLKHRHPDRHYGELQSRIRTWWVIAALFLGSLLAPRAVTLAFFGFISFLALKEYFSLIPARRADRRVLFYAYAAIAVQYAWVYIDWYDMFVIFIPVYMFLFIPLRMVMIGETAGFLSAAGTIYWGLMTTVYSLSHLGMLLRLPFGRGGVWMWESASGAMLVIYLAVLTQLNDVAQYVWGKTLGRKKVVPKVSPGKTWAGVIGGVLTTTALAVGLAPYFTPLTRRESILAGLIIGIGGFFGDITVSAVKRDLHRKDSGSMLPGHGGILDRVDSLTFTAPLFFHFLRYLHF